VNLSIKIVKHPASTIPETTLAGYIDPLISGGKFKVKPLTWDCHKIKILDKAC
jgi:hypothetical protein